MKFVRDFFSLNFAKTPLLEFPSKGRTEKVLCVLCVCTNHSILLRVVAVGEFLLAACQKWWFNRGLTLLCAVFMGYNHQNTPPELQTEGCPSVTLCLKSCERQNSPDKRWGLLCSDKSSDVTRRVSIISRQGHATRSHAHSWDYYEHSGGRGELR